MAVISTSPNVTYLMCISYILFAVCSLTITVIDARSVPDGYVYTDQHKTARKGDQLVLRCDFFGTPVGVFWKKGDNPEKSPDLITDVDGEPPSGSCLADQSCEFGEDYTLIINQVNVADQGTYICRVSNYLGVLIHNFTEVTVYAPPMEPFPVIKECPMKDSNDTQQTCSLSTSENVNITCSASGYYPDIDLFFLHGSQQLVRTNTTEVTNLDGTKNKSILTLAEPSINSYVCVASDIPGSREQRTVSIKLDFPEVLVPTTARSQTPVPGPNVAKIVVPVVIIIILLLLVLLCVALWLRRRQEFKNKNAMKDNTEAIPLYAETEIAGKISFYELWYLTRNMDETDLQNLKYALINHGISVDKVPSQNQAYELLCKWKDTDTCDDEQMALRNTLRGYTLGCPLERMMELKSTDRGAAISEERLYYVVQQFDDEKKFTQFLLALTGRRQEKEVRPVESKDDILKHGIEEIMKWRELKSNGDHFILISLALESAKCQPLDRTFFRIPDHLIKPITQKEVKKFVYGLTGRHCRRIAEAVGIKDEQKIKTTINENNEELFDTQAMIDEWIAEQECSNYGKRCKLDDAITKIGRHDLTDSFGTASYRFEAGEPFEIPHRGYKTFNFGSIFNDDLAVLLKHLPPSAVAPFLEKLGITVADEDNIEEKLQGWRTDSVNERRAIPLKELCLIHRNVLKETNSDKDYDVTDDELESILESITSSRVLDHFTASLGVKNDREWSHMQRLKEWRDTCTVEKPRKLLREKCNASRLSGCILDLLPQRHVYQVEMVRFAYYILWHDIEPLATLLDMNTGIVKKVGAPTKGTVGLLIELFNKSKDIESNRRMKFSSALGRIGYMGVARSAYFGYGASLSELYNWTSGLSKDIMEILKGHLKIDTGAMTTAEQQDMIKVMKAWINQPRQGPIHFRIKLALGLRAAGQHATADYIIAGGYWTAEVCSDVVESICSSLDDHQRKELCKHLKLESQKDENKQTSKLVTDWVRDWLNRLGKMSLKTVFASDNLSPQVKEIDELFKAGFFELAEEIMLLGVSKLSSAKRANKKSDESSNKDEKAQLSSDSTGSSQTLEDQHQVSPTAEQSDDASPVQVSADGSAEKEDGGASDKPNEHTPLIEIGHRDSSESSV